MEEVQRAPAQPRTNLLEEAAPANRKPAWWQRAPAILLGTIALAGLLFYGLSYLAESLTYESTDDAFLDADIISIAPKVAGRVKQVHATANQAVKAGDLLLEIDPADLQVQLDQKRAAVAAARANTELLKATVALFQTQIASAEATAKQTAAEAAASQATAEQANTDLKRAQELIQNHTISPQEFDRAKSVAVAAEANLRAAREKAASDQSKVAQAQAQLEAGRRAFERGEAQTRQAEWEAQAAELNLSYTRVTAPEEGRITKKAVQSGDYVQVGQNLMALVPNQLYVTANFKETQLRQIRTNQLVRITVDSVDHGPFAGYVESVQAGSGARFSLLPPENAVGNYVKVVQRIPVRVFFRQPLESGHVLGPGMSVVPSVHVTTFEIPQLVILIAAILLACLIGLGWGMLARRKRKAA